MPDAQPQGPSSTAHPPTPGAGVLAAAQLARCLREGAAGLFPTDTLPALAACPEAAAQLWELKGRPSQKPVILMGSDPDELLAQLGLPVLPAWRQLAQAHWPGGLTLVLPARGPVLAQLNPDGHSLGLRVPACPMALELLTLTGPLATTSANRSGEPSCQSAAEAQRCFPALPLLGPIPWPAGCGQASTVVSWREDGSWEVLRQGALRLSASSSSPTP